MGCEVYQYQPRHGRVEHGTTRNVWGLYIATFIFWIGMSHSGTLLSAILLIIHADWRKPIYRFAEAMTTFSLMTAGMFVLVHLGRLWQFYYVLPYPNERWAWPNFQSPLVWDATAIGSYLTPRRSCSCSSAHSRISRSAATTPPAGAALLHHAVAGLEGTDRQWRNFRVTYLAIACLLIPLAVSVHSIVATDFAMSQQPGWHTTSFPPYFVAGALYSGCAAIITLFIMLRHVFRFEEYMTMPILDKTAQPDLRHLDGVDVPEPGRVRHRLVRRQRGGEADAALPRHRALRGYWWAMNFLGSVLPFTLIFKKIRANLTAMMVISLLLNLGMWLERWMIVTPTFSHGYYPWTWDHGFFPSLVQWGIVLGSFGWFGMLFMLFCKLLPSVSMYEVKEMVYHRGLARRHAKREA